MVYVVILRGNKTLALKFPTWQRRGMSKLRTFRKAKGLSQEEVADGVGVQKSMISRIERGKRVPSMRLATALSELFKGEVTANDFMQAAGQQSKAKEAAQ